MPYVLEPMQEADIAEVAAVERECFATPWPIAAYRRELRNPASNRYVVVRWVHPQGRHPNSNGAIDLGTSLRRGLHRLMPSLFEAPETHHNPYKIIGFGGLWLMPDEGHITTIGVSPAHRGKGIGEMLFLGMLDLTLEQRSTWLTLEVRVSNVVAQALYRKYGMQTSGIRKHYYSDNGEDAYIMSAGPLQSEAFRRRLGELRASFLERLRRLEADEAAALANRQ